MKDLPNKQTKKFVKIGEASEKLGVSIDTLRRWEKAGKIETIRTPGGTRLYSTSTLKDLTEVPRKYQRVEQKTSKSITVEDLIDDLHNQTSTYETIPQTDQKLQEFIDERKFEPEEVTVLTEAEVPVIPASSVIPAEAGIHTNKRYGSPIRSGMTKGFGVSHNKKGFFFSHKIYAVSAFLGVLAILILAVLVLTGLTNPTGKLAQIINLNQAKHNLTQTSGVNLDPQVLAASTASYYLDINSDVVIEGDLAVAKTINGLTLTPNPDGFSIAGGTTTSRKLTVLNGDVTLDQDVSTKGSPSFVALKLPASSKQIVMGGAGTLTWTPTGTQVITFPNATGTVLLDSATQTITNKTISGSSNTITNLPNSALTNNKITITAGTNLTGGGDISLGSSGTISLSGDISLTSIVATGDIKAATFTGTSYLTLSQTTAPSTTTDKLYNVSGNLFWNGTDISQAGVGILPVGTNGQTLYNLSGTWTATSNLFNNGTNVGIGSTSPGELLTLRSAAPAIRLEETSSTGGKIDFYNSAGTAQATISRGAASNSLFLVNASSDGSIVFYTNNTEAARINSSGYFGIGASVPGGALDIYKNITGTPSDSGSLLNIRYSTFTDNATAASGTVGWAVSNNFGQPTLTASNTGVTTTHAYNVYIPGAPLAGANETITNAAALFIETASVVSTGTVNNAYGLYVGAPIGAANNYAAVFLNGNVGIGTATPQQKLEVNGAGYFSSGVYIGANNTNNLISTASTGASSTQLYIGNLPIVTTTGTGGSITGSTNQVGYFTGTNTLGGSNNFWFNGTNVGIGTTNPTSRLAVVGSTSDTSATAFNITNSTGQSLMQVYNDGSTSIGRNNSSVSLGSYTLAVGIGTTNTSSSLAQIALEIGPTINNSSTAQPSYTGLDVVPTINGANNISNINGGWFGPTYSGSGSIVGGIYGVGSMLTLNSGTVNIIYGMYSNPLVMGGTVTGGVYSGYFDANYIGGTVNNNYGVFIADQTGGANTNVNLALGTVPTSGNFSLYSSSAYNSYFAGNVGIGTTNPGSKLAIVDGNQGLNKVFTSDASGNGTWTTIAGAGGVTGTGTSNYVAKWSGTSTLSTGIIWDNGTNVGIGTTNPLYALELSKTGVADIVAKTTDVTTSSLASVGAISDYAIPSLIAHSSARTVSRYGLTLGGWAELTLFTGTGGTPNGMVIGTNQASPLVFGTNDLERMRIDSAGNVGIGTTNPQGILHIKKDAGVLVLDTTSANKQFNIDFRDNNIQEWSIYKTPTNQLSFWSYTVPTGDKLTLDTTGNIGIGTTVPGQKLEVTGAGYFSSGVYIGANNTNNLISTASTGASSTQLYIGNLPIATTTGTGGSFAGSANQVGYFTGTNTLGGSNNFWFNGTNVGIGTTAPLSTLGVLGNAAIGATYGSLVAPTSGLIVEGNVGIGTTSPVAKLEIAAPATGTTSIINVASGYKAIVFKQAGTEFANLGSSGAGANMYFTAASGKNFVFVVGGGTTEIATYYSNGNIALAKSGGNVGIGTTASLSTLGVLGKTSIGATYGNIAAPTSGLIVEGNVGIGTTSPVRSLETTGSIRMGPLITGGGTAVAMYRDANGDLADSTSSILYKTDITPYPSVLDKVMKLNAVNFKWNDLTPTPGAADFGMIAEQVNSILPDLVIYNADGVTPHGLKYDKMGLVALKAIQELSTQVNSYNLKLDADGNIVLPKVKIDKLVLSADIPFDETTSQNYFDVAAALNAQIANSKIQDTNILGLETQVASQSARLQALSAQADSGQAVIASNSEAISTTKSALDSLKETISSLSAQIASSSATPHNDITDLKLTPPDLLLATGSATLANLNVTSEATVSGQLTAYSATISDTFKALGNSFLGNTTVAGDFSVDGTLSLTGNSINSISTLYLQSSPLSNLVDLFNGKVTIDKTGKLVVQKLILPAEVLGETTIPAGSTEISISTTAVTDKSKIFLTAITPTGGQAIVLGDITPGTGFVVKLDHIFSSNIKFNWMIIDQK